MPRTQEYEGRTRGEEWRSPYKEFSSGQTLDFELLTVAQDLPLQLITGNESRQIDVVTGGGFWGRVLIVSNPEREERTESRLPDKVVIKSPLPDPWHDIWRRVNWGFQEFPPQVNILDAQLEHVGTRMIHSALKNLTGGKIYSPQSYGIAKLPTGYGQVLEFVEGRGPRFDTEHDEILEFRQIQHKMKQLGYELGLEHTGQIHPDNPYGFANVWKDEENNRFIWLDTLAAFKHTGWVAPGLRFGFHYDLREQFGSFTSTFNKIHLKRFEKRINEEWYLFPPEELEALRKDMAVYKQLQEAKVEDKTPVKRDFTGMILAVDEHAYDKLSQFPPIRFSLDQEYRKDKIMGVRDFYRNEDRYRKRKVLKFTTLRGIERSYEHNLITKDERDEVWEKAMEEDLPVKELSAATLTAVLYFLIAVASKSYEGASYIQSFREGDLLQAVKAFSLSTVLTPLARGVGTYGIGAMHLMNNWRAALLSMIPTYGNVLGITTQISEIAGDQEDKTWHHMARNVNAGVSSATNPGGGYGTYDEIRKWRLFGRFIERIGKKKRKSTAPQGGREDL